MRLHAIAPRLALARDIRRMELDYTGEYPGEDVTKVLSADVRVGRCRCGGMVRVYDTRERLLVGCNAGEVAFISSGRCGDCGTGTLSNHDYVYPEFSQRRRVL